MKLFLISFSVRKGRTASISPGEILLERGLDGLEKSVAFVKAPRPSR